MGRIAPKLPDEDEHFLLILPGQDGEVISREDLLTYLETLISYYFGDSAGSDNEKGSDSQQAEFLLDTACELLLPGGDSVQWYAVRLHKTKQ